MTNKAYIVANEQQEREVLIDLENQGYTWDNLVRSKPTVHVRKLFDGCEGFPYALFANENNHRIRWDKVELSNGLEIVYDGRKESKMKISKEVYDALMEWRDVINKSQLNNFVGKLAINKMDGVIYNWWSTGKIDDKEGNNRLIAILRWVNGEDVFEVEKPKKWVVRSKEPQGSVDGEPLYIWFVDELTLEIETEANMPPYIRRFNTKEEAQSWANAHQEVIEVEE